MHALLAGTLALMTHFAESRCPRGGRAYSPMSGVPWEFRAALAKLGARWSLLEEQARKSMDAGAVRR